MWRQCEYARSTGSLSKTINFARGEERRGSRRCIRMEEVLLASRSMASFQGCAVKCDRYHASPRPNSSEK